LGDKSFGGSLKMKKVGFIGLGNMGLPMANNIIKAGIEVNAFDLSADAMQRAEELGMTTKNHASEVTENIDALITMLPNDKAVENIYLKEDLIEQISQSTIVIESSTINPEVSKKVSKKATETNISMLDAPVSGGVKGAESGTLTFIVGGDEADLQKAAPLLDIMGDKTFYAGQAGAGQIAKLCNNMLLAIHMCGTAETIAMGVNNGLDPAVLSEIMKNSSGGNWSLEKYNPYPGVMKGAPASNGYSGGFLNSLMLKDLNLAEELAAKSKSNTPMGRLAKELYEELNNQGLEGLDFSSIQKNYLDT
jgi:3-hydroxyisobutyrate dehydrogenase